jgi:hypothetical protein
MVPRTEAQIADAVWNGSKPGLFLLETANQFGTRGVGLLDADQALSAQVPKVLYLHAPDGSAVPAGAG